jgi:hypothetical protein
VVLGLLRAEEAREKIWEYFLDSRRAGQEDWLTGALWGLVDLEDPRAGRALVALLQEGWSAQELFGFLARAGGAEAVLPLVEAAGARQKEEQAAALMALAGVARRIGREALLAELDRAAEGEAERDENRAIASRVLAIPGEAVEEFFALFYRGFQEDEARRAMDRLQDS